MRSGYSLGPNLSPILYGDRCSPLGTEPLVRGGQAEACKSLGGHTVWELDRQGPQGRKENRISTQALQLRGTLGQNYWQRRKLARNREGKIKVGHCWSAVFRGKS